VFGASGFIGRHLVLALAADGVQVTAAVRSDASHERRVAWLYDHRCIATPTALIVDFDASDSRLVDPDGLTEVTEVHICAGAHRFGMTQAEARNANVDGVRRIVYFVADLAGSSGSCTSL
jgi:nucleoside-diphosphate-sugar epimerase